MLEAIFRKTHPTMPHQESYSNIFTKVTDTKN